MKLDFTEQVSLKTNEELEEILLSPDKYSPEFVQTADNELLGRGIQTDALNEARKQKLLTADATLYRSKKGNPAYIIICFILAFFGGLLAIFAGYTYAYSKNKTSQGEDVFVYDEETRKLGSAMMVIGIVVFCLTLLYKLGSNV
ncbi:hypothetical protein ACTHGU_15665 [Chitinophagaceae bacterium MMS25-I14]